MSHIRQSFRSLARTPVLSLVIITTLGLGIGSTVAVFTLIDGVVFRPLPYPHAERLVQIDHAAPGIQMESLGVSHPLYELYRDHGRAMDEVVMYHDLRMTLAGDGRPDRLEAARLTPSIFPALGVEPVLGRPFSQAESELGAPPVVVISHDLWQRKLGGGDGVLGSLLRLDGVAHEVIGVLPEGMTFPKNDTALWLPRIFDEQDRQLSFFNDHALGRLAPGASLELARADLERLSSDLETYFPGEAQGFGQIGFAPALESRLDRVVGQGKDLLWVLMAAVGLILVIAAANVANLFLVRVEERSHELALRSALGARRRQLIQGLLRESLLLATAAGVLGLGLGWLAVEAVVTLGGAMIPRLDGVSLGAGSLLFTLTAALTCGLLFGLLPALRATRTARPALRTVRSSTAGRQRHRLRAALVVSQLALGLVLAVACSLVVRSFFSLRAVDPGFRADGALTFRTVLPDVEYPDPVARKDFVEAALERLESIPGATHVGAASYLPLSGTGAGTIFQAEGEVPREGPSPASRTAFVSAGYIEAMDIQLIAGRTFEPTDHQLEAPNVMVSESFARRAWGDDVALGRRVRPAGGELWHTVVGVVGDVNLFRLDEPKPEFIYLPLVGHPQAASTFDGKVSFVVRTERQPIALTPMVLRLMTELNPSLAVSTVQPLATLVEKARSAMGFAANMLTLASIMALVIAAVGLYGTISFLVGRRRREIGIRLALGARRSQVQGSILAQGLTLAALGVGLGLALSVAVAQLLASVLYEVSALDPISFLAMPLVLLTVAAAATQLPARRASRLEPLEALRDV